MFKFIIGLILVLMPLIVFGDHAITHPGYSDLEIVNLINGKIRDHAKTTISIVAMFMAGLGGTLVWLFFLINEHKKVVMEMEEVRYKNHSILMGKIDESYTHVDEKLNKHVLHVANNYTRDDKIERMMERTVKPMQNQLTLLQNSLNDHFSNKSRYTDKT